MLYVLIHLHIGNLPWTKYLMGKKSESELRQFIGMRIANQESFEEEMMATVPCNFEYKAYRMFLRGY
jgi:hypothetical protein